MGSRALVQNVVKCLRKQGACVGVRVAAEGDISCGGGVAHQRLEPPGAWSRGFHDLPIAFGKQSLPDASRVTCQWPRDVR